jgi:zinc transport system substrate-binding protein
MATPATRSACRVRAMLLLLPAGLAVAAGCQRSDGPPANAGPLTVFAAIDPVAYVVERVGGDRVDVHALVRTGADPHTFQPTPRQMTALARARVYFKVGLPVEDQILEKIQPTPGQLAVVDVAQGVTLRMMTSREACGHEGHEADHAEAAPEHSHESHAAAPDPHIWFSPPLLKIQAGNVARGLKEADPEHAADYDRNLAAFVAELDGLDGRIRVLLGPYQGRTFYTFHPACGYFADAYGLKQSAVEVEGKNPSPKQLRGLIQQARAEGVKVIFAQPEFDPRAARTVAEAIGGSVVTIDPLGRDVLLNLEETAKQMAAAMGGSPGAGPETGKER